MKLTHNEILMLANLIGAKKDLIIDSIERKSEREFDLIIFGAYSNTPHSFSGWMPLFWIKNRVNWVECADETDYPWMAQEGDWSAVRDSSEETIWKMFNKHLK